MSEPRLAAPAGSSAGQGAPAVASAGCLCGQLRVQALGPPLRVGICHCMDCRKHHGALFHASAIFPAAAVQVTGQVQAWAGRHFCPRCGSSVFSRSGDELDLHLGALDAPGQFRPTYELWAVRREPWLPAFPGTRLFARDADGSAGGGVNPPEAPAAGAPAPPATGRSGPETR